MRSRSSFYFTEALRSLSTNKATSFAAIVSMLIALIIVGMSAAFWMWSSHQSTDLQKDAGLVHVFIRPSATDAQINALHVALERNPNVEKVEVVSKEQALKRAQEMFKDSDVMKNLPGNPFPASLEATLKDPTQMDSVAKTMVGQPGVDEVKTGDETARKAIRGAQFFSLVVVVLGIIVLIIATVLVINTIRLSIYSRRREIEVMKLVGASNGFVRMPFMIEGFLCGVFAAAVAAGALLVGKHFLTSFLHSVFKTETIGGNASGAPMGLIVLGMLVLGVGLGMLGSAASMRKYLRV
jgi:cell division transport system permease protein